MKYEIHKKTIGFGGRKYRVLANKFQFLKDARKYKVYANVASPHTDYYFIVTKEA